mmetsp:Transcript_6899/g.19966  ORF Transcript_6899/g.19966 Transcript_6899/m.19966 type:complete len:166 (-) Transcript_6899:39-536(-)
MYDVRMYEVIVTTTSLFSKTECSGSILFKVLAFQPVTSGLQRRNWRLLFLPSRVELLLLGFHTVSKPPAIESINNYKVTRSPLRSVVGAFIATIVQIPDLILYRKMVCSTSTQLHAPRYRTTFNTVDFPRNFDSFRSKSSIVAINYFNRNAISSRTNNGCGGRQW